VDFEDEHASAFRDEFARDAFAQTQAGASDDCDLVF
jgi:hypothetical protein